jgi:O-antigen ligase
MQIQSVTTSLASDSRSATLHVPLERPIPKLVRWTFLLFVASIPLEALPIENVTSEDFTLTKMFGFVFFASYLLRSGLPLRLDLPAIPAAFWGFLAYLAVYAFAGLEYLKDEGIRRYVMALIQLGQFFVLFWFASGLLRDPSFAKKALLTMAIACVGVAAGTVIGLPGFESGYGGPRTSTFDFSPNTLAALMAYAAIIIIGFCLKESGWSAKRKLCLFALTIPLFLVLVSSGSRTSMVAFVVGMSVFFVPQRGSRRKKIAFGVVLAAIAGTGYLVLRDPLASERWTRTIEEGHTSGRGDIYAAALGMIAERPIAGWGGREAFQTLAYRLGIITRGHRDAHNLVLYLLLEVGLIGTIPFLIALGLCVRSAWKGRAGPFGMIPLALIMTMLVLNMTYSGLKQKPFWLFLGFAVAASSINRELRYRWIASRTGRRPAGTNGEELRPRVSVVSNS